MIILLKNLGYGSYQSCRSTLLSSFLLGGVVLGRVPVGSGVNKLRKGLGSNLLFLSPTVVSSSLMVILCRSVCACPRSTSLPAPSLRSPSVHDRKRSVSVAEESGPETVNGEERVERNHERDKKRTEMKSEDMEKARATSGLHLGSCLSSYRHYPRASPSLSLSLRCLRPAGGHE